MSAAPPPDSASLDALMAALKTPAVRDLAWLVTSPPLLRAAPGLDLLADPGPASPDEAAAIAAWLRELDRAPGALVETLADTRTARMGRYAECLLGWFLAHGPAAARLVAANVVVHSDQRAGRTLGECDFLVETRAGRKLHWELAVKCYLRADDRGTLADFVGPGLQDRFDMKYAHLLDHQLTLSARGEFAALGFPGPWHAQMLVKGWLFHRASEAADAPTAPELASRYLRGWWATHDEWRSGIAGRADGWRALPRLQWLAPRVDDSAAALSGADELLDAVASRTAQPLMVAGFDVTGDGIARERTRGFVVPDDWPAAARAFARAELHHHRWK